MSYQESSSTTKESSSTTKESLLGTSKPVPTFAFNKKSNYGYLDLVVFVKFVSSNGLVIEDRKNGVRYVTDPYGENKYQSFCVGDGKPINYWLWKDEWLISKHRRGINYQYYIINIKQSNPMRAEMDVKIDLNITVSNDNSRLWIQGHEIKDFNVKGRWDVELIYMTSSDTAPTLPIGTHIVWDCNLDYEAYIDIKSIPDTEIEYDGIYPKREWLRSSYTLHQMGNQLVIGHDGDISLWKN